MITIEKLVNNNKEKFAVCNLGTKRIEIQHDMIADKYILVTKHKRTVKTEFQLNENDLKKVQTKINKLYQQTIDDLVASGNPIPPMYFQVNENTHGIRSNKEWLFARLDFLDKGQKESGWDKKPILYTHGFSFMNPTTHNKPISIDEAKRIINENSWWDAQEDVNAIYINTFSENDMY